MKNRMLHAVLALLVAVVIWGYVITVENPEGSEIYYNIPVVLDGETLLAERGFMITEGMDQTVTLKVSGNRSDLAKINKSNITIIADLTRVYTGGKNKLTFDVRFPGDVADNALTIQSRDPDVVTVTVEERTTKYVPVQINYTGAVPQGFFADKENAVLDNAMITVKGPKSVVERIDNARIDVDMTDRTESFREELRFTLCDRDGEPVNVEMVTANVDSVRLEVKIQSVKEIPLTLTVVDGGGATEATSTIIIEPASLRLAGNQQMLDKLTEINLGTVNLAEILEDTELEFPLNVPDELQNLNAVETAKVTIQFPNLSKKTIRVTGIQAVNVPEGMKAEIVTQAIDITVRGTTAQVEAMTDKDFTVTVDFTGAEAGNYTAKAIVSINPNYAGVGCIGSYSVSVNMAEDIPETEEKQN